MQQTDLVFVVLVYRNAGDLDVFLNSLAAVTVPYRVVVVNSFYDEPSRRECEDLCGCRGCDFINVENRGYGCGNNSGIAYAKAHYGFKFLAVCNPDIEIQEFSEAFLQNGGRVLVGPAIRTLTGKRQNPCMVLYSPFREALMKMYARRPSNPAPFYAAVAVNKLERIAFNCLFGGRVRRVYSLHGCCLFFSAQALEAMGGPFDPAMFLFREEDHLARLARRLGIPMLCDPRIKVLHKEDGSVRFMDEGVKRHTVDSLRCYFGIKSN